MKKSFGILLCRFIENGIQFLLVHPGGPFWKNKYNGTWSIPKGEGNPYEDPLDSAIREFEEETGYRPSGNFIELNPIIQKGGKQVFCWALSGQFDPATLVSNSFDLEWPPKSGKTMHIPEVDEAGWFGLEDAKLRINEKQIPLLYDAVARLSKVV
ncbi:NUDIX domain-containing protein [Pedobacter sp. PWIIR3]